MGEPSSHTPSCSLLPVSLTFIFTFTFTFTPFPFGLKTALLLGDQAKEGRKRSGRNRGTTDFLTTSLSIDCVTRVYV
jgi:hypothetical protein